MEANKIMKLTPSIRTIGAILISCCALTTVSEQLCYDDVRRCAKETKDGDCHQEPVECLYETYSPSLSECVTRSYVTGRKCDGYEHTGHDILWWCNGTQCQSGGSGCLTSDGKSCSCANPDFQFDDTIDPYPQNSLTDCPT